MSPGGKTVSWLRTLFPLSYLDLWSEPPSQSQGAPFAQEKGQQDGPGLDPPWQAPVPSCIRHWAFTAALKWETIAFGSTGLSWEASDTAELKRGRVYVPHVGDYANLP